MVVLLNNDIPVLEESKSSKTLNDPPSLMHYHHSKPGLNMYFLLLFLIPLRGGGELNLLKICSGVCTLVVPCVPFECKVENFAQSLEDGMLAEFKTGIVPPLCNIGVNPLLLSMIIELMGVPGRFNLGVHRSIRCYSLDFQY